MPSYAFEGQQPALPEDGSAWVAPSADLIGDVRLGRDAGVWFGAVIRADNTPIIVGDGTNIQEGAMLHSDPDAPLVVGRGCTVGHHAILHGCTIGDNVLIGMGATILNHAVIPDNCLIGAGALVTERKTFEPGSLIVGSPAKAVRPLSAEAIAEIGVSAAGYRTKAKAFREGLRRVD